MDLCVIATIFLVFILNIFIGIHGANASGYCLDPGYTPSNGSRNPSVDLFNRYFPGSVIRYECDDGYKLIPNQNIQTCNYNVQGVATWQPEKPPSCVEVAICAKPYVPHATIWKEIFHEGEYLNEYFSCDLGFTLAQENNFWCLESGEWSDIPSCLEKNCTYPPMIQNGYHSFYSPKAMRGASPDKWPSGTAVYYNCERGYQLDPASQSKRVCENGEWSGVDPECVQEGCPPPDPSEGRYIPKLDHYEVHNTITYICRFDDDVTRTCKANHTWSGTPCPNALTTQQMPYTPNHNDNVYCATPQHVMHGSFECCSKGQVTNTDKEDYCCPVRGVVEFACDVGYMTKDVTQWICGTAGKWIAVDTDNAGTPTVPPTCYSNTTRPNPNPMPDEILRPVIGVAAGVFLILSVAIIIAFCRPKLKDMKRRWRKLREDDDEIIIDGRRILLPSYEEAVTSSNPYLAQITEPRPTSDDGPSTSQGYDNVNIINTRDDASMIFEVHNESAREHPRNSSSSDEEMLVPNNRDERAESSQAQKIENDIGVSQPLILTTGIDVDSYVLINKPSTENFSKNNTPASELDGKGQSQCQLADRHGLSSNFSVGDVAKPNDFNDSENDSDNNLDSIFPKTILMPENNRLSQQPPINEGLNLLSYPIMPLEADSRENCGHEAISISIKPENISLIEDESATNPTAVKNEENAELSEREDYESQPIMTNSDHIHIVMSRTSNMNNEQQQQDETGSTTV